MRQEEIERRGRARCSWAASSHATDIKPSCARAPRSGSRGRGAGGRLQFDWLIERAAVPASRSQQRGDRDHGRRAIVPPRPAARASRAPLPRWRRRRRRRRAARRSGAWSSRVRGSAGPLATLERAPARATPPRPLPLAIPGFKSYRDPSRLAELGRFSCVVGPNGCGKSVLVRLGCRLPRPAARRRCSVHHRGRALLMQPSPRCPRRRRARPSPSCWAAARRCFAPGTCRAWSTRRCASRVTTRPRCAELGRAAAAGA
jgi:hypothetical protein